MKYIWSAFATKGGVGKTTTAVNIAGVLAERGNNVLIIDLDFHHGLTDYFGVDSQALTRSMYDVLLNQHDITDILIETPAKNITLAPGKKQLKELDEQLVRKPSWEQKLLRAIAPIEEQYDAVIMDCHGDLNLAAKNAFFISQAIISPVECQNLSYQSILELLEEIWNFEQEIDQSIPILVYRNKMNHTNLAKDVSEKLATALVGLEQRNTHLLKRDVRDHIKIANASTHKIPVTEYYKNGEQAYYYRQLTDEVLSHAQ